MGLCSMIMELFSEGVYSQKKRKKKITNTMSKGKISLLLFGIVVYKLQPARETTALLNSAYLR